MYYFYCKIQFDQPLSRKEGLVGMEFLLSDRRICRIDFADVSVLRNGSSAQFFCSGLCSDLFQKELTAQRQLAGVLEKIRSISAVSYCCNGEPSAHPVRILEAEIRTSGRKNEDPPPKQRSRYMRQDCRRYFNGWECVYIFRKRLLRTFQGSP